MSVADLARFDRQGDRFDGDLPEAWSQGPGIYGGLLAAALGDALERAAERPLRALSLHLCAPARPGPQRIEVREERKGAAVSFFSARLLDPSGQAVVIASATLGGPRATDVDTERSVAPAIGPPGSLPDFAGVPGAPVFTRNFEMRFFEGVPFSGFGHPRTSGWLRPRAPEPVGTALVLALLDVWPLALLPLLKAPRPAASVTMQLHLMHPLPELPSDAWFQVDVRSDVLRQGWSDQTTSLWDARGRLVGRCVQLTTLR